MQYGEICLDIECSHIPFSVSAKTFLTTFVLVADVDKTSVDDAATLVGFVAVEFWAKIKNNLKKDMVLLTKTGLLEQNINSEIIK